MNLPGTPVELIGLSRETKRALLLIRGWKCVKGIWIDPRTGKSHTWGWALRIAVEDHRT